MLVWALQVVGISIIGCCTSEPYSQPIPRKLGAITLRKRSISDKKTEPLNEG